MWPERATVGRQPSRCVCNLGGFFHAAITTWVSDWGRKPADDRVRQRCAFLHSQTSQPLLTSPKKVAQTLYWYDSVEDGYTLTLGEWTMDPPPAPTWREFFISEGIAHQTEKDADGIWSTTPLGLRIMTSQ